MKGLQVLILSCLAAVAFSQETTTEAPSIDSRIGNTNNTRILGGLLGLGGLNPGLSGVQGTIGNNLFYSIGFNPGLGAGIGVSNTCRYWCRTPRNSYYCCEGNDQIQGPVGVKPGFCPPVRPQCPPVRNFAPPQTCSNDYRCSGIDKCCFDTCLQEHVCKPPLGSIGFPIGYGYLKA